MTAPTPGRANSSTPNATDTRPDRMSSARVPAVSPLETGEELGDAADKRPGGHDDDQHERGRRGPDQGDHAGRQVDQPEQQVTEDRPGGPAVEGPRGLPH